MKKLGLFVWQFPVTLPIWLFYLLPFWALGFLRLKLEQDADVWVFEVVRDRAKWWRRLWRKWLGHAMPYAVVLNISHHFVLRHEKRHCRQWARYGVFFPAIYLILLAIYGYNHHPFENEALRAE